MTRLNTAARAATGVPPRPLAPNSVDLNPYMGRASAIHNDTYSSGGGLAWGAGTTPTLTKDLALFTDNAMPNKLLALSLRNGTVVASAPILDKLPKGARASVILVRQDDKQPKNHRLPPMQGDSQP